MMMKKKLIILLLALCTGSYFTHAQTTEEPLRDSLEVMVGNVSMKVYVDSIANEEERKELMEKLHQVATSFAAKHEDQLMEIDQKEAAGDLSEEQANEERMELLEDISEKLEDYELVLRGDTTRTQKTAVEQTSKKVLFSGQGIKIVEQEGSGKEKIIQFSFREDDSCTVKEKKNRRTHFHFGIHYGLNNLIDNDALVSDQNAELKTWKSTAFELEFTWRTRLFSQRSPLHLEYGFGFAWNNYRLKSNNIITKTPAGTDFISDTANNVSKSKYKNTWLQVPLIVQLDFGRGEDRGFLLGVGGYAGLRLHTSSTVKYDDFNGDAVKSRVHNNFFMNNVRYGIVTQVGYGAMRLQAKYDLNTLFRDNKGPDFQVASLTFGFSF